MDRGAPLGLLVLDEAAGDQEPGRAAEPGSQGAQAEWLALRASPALPSRYRVGDLWSIFDFLNPGLLGGVKEFSQFVKRSGSYGPTRRPRFSRAGPRDDGAVGLQPRRKR